MAEGFDYINAPQFFDFTKSNTEDDDDLDIYFVLDHEKHVEDPLQVEQKVNEEKYSRSHNLSHLRRSMSVGDIQYLEAALNNADILRTEKETKKIVMKKATSNISLASRDQQNRRWHSRDRHVTSLDHVTQKARSQDFVDRLARPKQYVSLEANLNVNQYVSMAEAVRNFQSDTPERFHSRRKGEFNPPIHEKMTNTKAHTPRLMANKRTRPVTVLSREERELQEFKEAQKFKIKANPLNKKVLHGPVRAPVLKKSATVPEPFNLTRLPQKKSAPSPPKIPEFHARPVPAAVKNKPPPVRPPPQVTIPETPTFMRRYQKATPKRVSQSKEEPKPVNMMHPRKTELMPFSFEVRDRQMLKKKENFIKNVLEEEKKAREFHAKPVPKNVLLVTKNVSLPKNGSHKSLDGIGSNENLSTQFKARPATVLQKKPFVPKPSDKPLPAFSEFKLLTEQRTESREMFKRHLIEMEEQRNMYKQMEELRLRQEEEAEIAKQRKMAEHKAQPIRKYKVVHIEHVKQVTEPVSPKFHTNRHRNSHDNKENMGNE